MKDDTTNEELMHFLFINMFFYRKK